MTRAAPTQAAVTIDCPEPGEAIVEPEYAVRISADGAGRVEVSIDHAPWRSCRNAAGYWWYDWSGYAPGKHQIRIQAFTQDGCLTALQGRRVDVQLEEGI